MARNFEIRIKVNKEEFEKIERKAGKLGLTVSAFLRFLGVSAKTPLELH